MSATSTTVLASKALTKTSDYLGGKRDQKNKEILESIAQHGLHPDARANRLRSYDPKKCRHLSINLANLPDNVDEEEIEVTCKNLIFSETEGAWHVVLERSYSDDFDLIESEERLSQSVLFVLKAPNKGNKYTPKDKILTRNFTSETACYPMHSFELETHMHFVSDKDILAIIVPVERQAMVKNIFPKIEIIPVSNIKKTAIFPRAKKISSDDRDVLRGPDFVEGLAKLIKSKKLRHFACHATRLFTCADMTVLNKDRLSLKEMLESYEAQDINHALRKAASNGKYWDARYLLDLGANVNAQGATTGKTALHQAVISNHQLMVSLLLDKKADKNIKDNSEHDAAHYLKSTTNTKLISLKEAYENLAKNKKERMENFRQKLFGSSVFGISDLKKIALEPQFNLQKIHQFEAETPSLFEGTLTENKTQVENKTSTEAKSSVENKAPAENKNATPKITHSTSRTKIGP